MNCAASFYPYIKDQCHSLTNNWRVNGAIILFAMISFSAKADTMRSSTNYGIQFDAIATGSGAMASASYSQPQTIIGADVIWNHYTSPGFDFQPIGIIRVPSSSRISTWGSY